MKFDVFNELSVPTFAERSEHQVYSQTLDQWALAESLGFHTAWLVEHHFMAQYSHSTAPEMFLAAASQRTQTLRLGHAIVPMPYHHPVRVAERLATLDILSNGRAEFGFGRGFSPKEYACFGVQMNDSRRYTEEALDIVRLSFEGAPIDYQGQHFELHDLEILPKVVQTPHPPLWTAAVSPDSFEMAAKQGIGVLVGPFKPWFMVKEDIRHYRAAWQRYHPGGVIQPGQNARAAMTVGVFCLQDARRARQLAKQPFTWFYKQLLNQTRPLLEQLYEGYEYYRKMGKYRALLDKAVSLSALDALGMAVVGDPKHCIKRLKALEKQGVDHVLCAFGAGAMSAELTEESMRVFAEQVMPAFDQASRD